MGTGGTERVILQLCEYLHSDFNIIVVSNGGHNIKKIEELGIKHYEIKDIEKKNPFIMITTLFKLFRIVRNEKINIIHTHHRMAAFYASIILKFSHNLRFIHTAHNTFSNMRKLTHCCLKHAEIIAVGKAVSDNLINFFGLDSFKIKIIYNSVPKDSTAPITINSFQKWRDEGNILVGNIGRLSKQKGIIYYLEAINQILLKYPKMKIHFFIVGDGEQSDLLEKYVDTHNLDRFVSFLGYRSDVSNILKQLDFIVLSSLWEGFPLTPIEAFSVGKTIIATNIDGSSEIVNDGINGILVPAQDPNEMAKAICFLSNDKVERKKLSEGALATYEKKFSFLNFVRKYKQIYYQ
jgi:glycosyltransferase involved in cell wall biosynthesis